MKALPEGKEPERVEVDVSFMNPITGEPMVNIFHPYPRFPYAGVSCHLPAVQSAQLDALRAEMLRDEEPEV